jgi:hypothetical protein
VETVLEVTDIDTLTPAFNGVMGWLSMPELNAIDPDALRFEIVDEVLFESGDVFVDVILC